MVSQKNHSPTVPDRVPSCYRSRSQTNHGWWLAYVRHACPYFLTVRRVDAAGLTLALRLLGALGRSGGALSTPSAGRPPLARGNRRTLRPATRPVTEE